MPSTDDWGGIAVESAPTDDWGGVAVGDDWGGVPVSDEPAPQAPQSNRIANLGRELLGGVASGVAQIAGGAAGLVAAPGRETQRNIGERERRIGELEAIPSALERFSEAELAQMPSAPPGYRTAQQEGELMSLRNTVGNLRQVAAKDQPLQTGAEDFQKLASEAAKESQTFFGQDPARQDEFLSKLARGAGSVPPYVLSGVMAGPAGSMLLGSLQTAQSEYDAAVAAGKPELAQEAFEKGLSIGMTEGVGIGGGLGTAAKDFGTRAVQTLATAAKEGGQEWVQTLLSNLNAARMTGYEPERPLLQGTGEAGAIGAILGGATQAINQAIPRAEQAAAPIAEAGAPATAEVVRQDPALAEALETVQEPVKPSAEPATQEPAPSVATAEVPTVPVTPRRETLRVVPTQTGGLRIERAPKEPSTPAIPRDEAPSPSLPGTAADAGEGLPPIQSPVRENKAQTSIVLPNGDVVVGGRFHGETFDYAEKLGVASYDDLVNGVSSFTTPEGRTWNLQGKDVPAGGRVIDLAKVQQEKAALAPTPAATEPAAPARTAPAEAPRQTVGETTSALGENKPVGGPGAMSPQEAAEMQAARKTTSTKNAVMEAEREARGADPILKEARVTNAETLDKAEAAIESNPNRGQEVVAKLNSGESVRNISVEEEAILLVEKTRLRNERDLQADRASDANATPEERAVARQEWEVLEGKINEMDQATHASGAEWGRLGQFRQRLLRDDYTFEAMERKARVAKGGALTPEESVKIKQQADRIAELEKQLEAKRTKATEAGATAAADEAVKKLGEQARKGGKADTTGKIADAIRKRVADGDSITDLRSLVQKLALNFVRSGVKERDPLITKVHEVISEIVEVTPQQTRDLISGYGDFKPLDTEAAKVTLRGLKGEMQQIGKIEDMQAKTAPKKTGIERRTPTDEERRLIKEVNELKKKGGFVVTDPANQLKSAMDAIKTRLRNELRDLETAIATQERLPGKKTELQYDAEATALKAQRDAKRAEYDQLFPKEAATPEQQIARAVKALDRSIEQLEGDLKAGKLRQPGAASAPWSLDISAKKARLEALRAERELLRDLDTATVEATKEAALVKAIEQAEKALPTKEATPTADTQRVAELKEKLAAVREARQQSLEAQAKRMEAAEESVRKSIAEYDRRLREGDVGPRTTATKPVSANLEALRAERDAMETLLRELRNAGKPKKSRDEIALQAYKTRTANRIAELEERTAKGDFTPRAKKPPLTLDPEATKLKFEIEKVKTEFFKQQIAYQIANETKLESALRHSKEAVNFHRAFFTGFDLSAVLNQGGFLVFGSATNPMTTARSLGAMVKAIKSDLGQFSVKEAISKRPNAERYQQAKLFLSDTHDITLRAAEEAFMSRWLNRLELSAEAGLKGSAKRAAQRAVNLAIAPIRGSARAYTAFLNQLRVETFDMMVDGLKASPDGEKVIADFINNATGRGGLGKFENSAQGMATVFFSPRFVTSRVSLLTGGSIRKALKAGETEAAARITKQYAKYMSALAVFYTLGMAAGGEVEKDPRSSDFGKLRFGDRRYDPLLGLSQVTVFLTRLATGESKNKEGKIVPLRKNSRLLNLFRKVPMHDKPKFGKTDASDTAEFFLRSKLAPVPGAVSNVVLGNAFGDYETTIGKEAKKLAQPMSVSSIRKEMEREGIPATVANSILILLGLRSNAFPGTATE